MVNMRRMVIAVVTLASVVAGCGDSGERGEAATSQAADPGSATTVVSSDEPDSARITPTELGDRIGVTYVEAIEELVALLRDRPSGPSALASVQELKESNVQEFVELGRLREALNAADRAAVDARIGVGVGGISSDLFAEYQEIQADYRTTDAEIAEVVSSFNIITQYANFDLLKEQEPGEAVRLLGE
jgi:hypothetical protein